MPPDQPKYYSGGEMDDVRRRLTHLESQQERQIIQLADVQGDMKAAKIELAFMRDDISQALMAVRQAGDTLNKWKGAIVIILIAAPIVGPLVTMLVRYLIFGAPLSK